MERQIGDLTLALDEGRVLAHGFAKLRIAQWKIWQNSRNLLIYLLSALIYVLE